MTRRRRKRRSPFRIWLRRIVLTIAAIPFLYLLGALIGSLVPINRTWSEPDEGTTIYLRSNGVHVDLILPARAQGLDWGSLLPERDFLKPPPNPKWFGFGAGEQRVYLETPRWRDIKPKTVWAGLTGGERVMHVERIDRPGPELRAIRLRPEEYRRLWASIRTEFDLDQRGLPQRVNHRGYWHDDAFYEGRGKADAIDTCNQWVAERLRVARVETSLWSPFAQGLMWRYRKVN